jgi:formate dehydrogenase maturation protein FdhE
MADKLFDGLGDLGGLLGGIAKSVIPKDTPEGKLLNAQSELADLQKQEAALLLEIGRAAYEQNPSAWPQDSKLKLVQQNMAAAQASFSDAKEAQEQAEAAKAEAEAQSRCPSCGTQNPEGVKFCQDCGSPLGAAGMRHCSACGAQLAPGTRFCGACGAGQEA